MSAHLWACVFHHAGGQCLHMLNHSSLKSLLSRPFHFLLVYVLFLLVIRKSPTSGSCSYKEHVRRWRQAVHPCHSSAVLFLSLTPVVSRRWQQSWETGRRDASPSLPSFFLSSSTSPRCPPALFLHLVCIVCHFRRSSWQHSHRV